jgi:Cdc6-like AAA superfamily ATPase
MKFYETHFEDYCKSVEKYHGRGDIVHSLDASENIIVYGSPGVGKYSQVLSMLKPYSPSQLKHDKKIKASTDPIPIVSVTFIMKWICHCWDVIPR